MLLLLFPVSAGNGGIGEAVAGRDDVADTGCAVGAGRTVMT